MLHYHSRLVSPEGQERQPRTEREVSPDAIRIDPEFAALIPPLSKSELALLEDSLRREGLREPLIVWQQTGILLDGHNQFALCPKLGIPLQISYRTFPDRAAVSAFILRNQMARRNLSGEAISYLRGKQYLELRNQGFRSDLTSCHDGRKSTAAKLAQEFQVGARTIHRDAQLALALDEICHRCGESVRPLLLSRDGGLRRSQIVRLGRMKPAEQRRFLEHLQETGKPPRQKRIRSTPKSITLPTEPKAFVDALLQQFNRRQTARIIKLLNDRAKDMK